MTKKIEIQKIAERYFIAQQEISDLEELIYESMLKSFKNGIEDIKCCAWYDNSIEFWIKEGTILTKKEQELVWSFGFSRCWLVVKGDKKRKFEKYYSVERN